MSVLRRLVCAVLLAGPIVTAGCAASTDVPARRLAPADLLLAPADLPPGFAVARLSVADLVASNRAAIDDARTVRFAPDFCRPTADAALNDRLRSENAAVLAARRASTSLVELVTTEQRDVGADLFATSGRCARTETTITVGNLAGTRIVTEYTQLPVPQVDGGLRSGERAVVVRSAVTTTLPDSGVRTQVGFAGYAILDRAASGPVTVQLTVAGETSPATPAPAPAAAPLTDAGFVDLFGTALEKVTARDG